MEQLKLFEGITNSDFPEYHKNNLHIYESFKKFAFIAIGKGHTRLSSDFIFHAIRWNTPIRADKDHFKLNNNYTPFYSRMFVNEHPEYKDFFVMKKSKFDNIKKP